MRYVFAGSDKTAAKVLHSLSEKHLPELVITREDAMVGRKKILSQTPVADTANALGVSVAKANNPSLTLAQITASGADLGVIVSYGAILKSDVLASLDWFNLHFSLLPKYRGAAPVQRAIRDGNTDSGITIFKLDEGMDTGKIYQQREQDISGLTTAEALKKLAEISVEPLFSLLADENPSLRAQLGEPSTASKLSREECYLDFKSDAETCLRIIRSSNPEPIAWTQLAGKPFRIISAQSTVLKPTLSGNVPGSVSKLGNRIYLRCADSTLLELVTVQPAAKKQMAALDWFNGVGEVILGH